MPPENLKERTAGAVKWNLVDRLSSQLLYAVTGIVLARLLSPADFGLVGAVLVFQAFGALLVDSGFSYALIQRKAPSDLDYSSVLWFNLAVATALYLILFAAAPLIAWCFGGDPRLIPLSRVMLLVFILNASAIVQTNRLMKQMNVRLIAASNALGLFAGAVVGIWLALIGCGAWAIVWQGLTLAAVKSLALWLLTGWRPLWRFSWASLRGFFAVGSGMMLSSFLSVTFQNIYAFFIGNRAGIVPLGFYSQADKWSKMGVTSLAQVMTSSFLPTLSAVQDDPARFLRASQKMNRLGAYLALPAMGFLAVMATPIFHALFGSKWDLAIVLFQLLLVRGVFTILTSLYNNYAVALAHTRLVVQQEAFRDALALLLLVACLPLLTMSAPPSCLEWLAAASSQASASASSPDLLWGVRILLLGQVAAAAVGWLSLASKVAPLTGRSLPAFLADVLPYLALTLVIMALLWAEEQFLSLSVWPLLLLQAASAILLYLAANWLAGSVIQRELLAYVTGRQSSHNPED